MKEIIISKAFIKVPSECPECHNQYSFKVKTILARCSRCGYKYKQPITQNPLGYYSELIENALSENNEVVIKTKDYEETLRRLKEQKEKQKCWDIGEIEDKEDTEKRIKCLDSGKCYNCITCFNCGEHYIPKKKIKCPKCSSDKIKPTLIRKFEEKDERKICPYCKSENIGYYYFMSDSKEIKCPLCGGKNLRLGRKIQVKQLIIKRLPKYKIE